MPLLACMMHWYASALFAAPVVGVGGWCWLGTRRMDRRASHAPVGSEPRHP